MSGKIKFRVLNEYPDGEFGFIYFGLKDADILERIVDGALIDQYTGVEDINKKEAYLGDILKKQVCEWLSEKQKEKCLAEKSFLLVKKEKDSNNMYLEYNFNIRGCWQINNLSITCISNYEIVGNIHQNKDLLIRED